MKKEILLLFCLDPARDPVAHHIWKACLTIYSPTPCPERAVEGKPVLKLKTARGNEIYLAGTSDVVSHDYARFRNDLNTYFGTADLIAVVNWHEGHNAPDKILCAHTTANVPSGVFGPASASELTAVLKALDDCRIEVGLVDWRVLGEASHWSGMVHGGKPLEILDIKASIIDVEIGSKAPEWDNADAHRAMAIALGKFPDLDEQRTASILFFGGVHFEPAVTEAIFASDRPCVKISHHLPNHWMVSGGYDKPQALDWIMQATRSVRDGVDGLAFHDGLKGPFKATLREAAARLNLPLFSHKKLRDADFMRTTFSQIYCEHEEPRTGLDVSS